jgi:hypothetical protein
MTSSATATPLSSSPAAAGMEADSVVPTAAPTPGPTCYHHHALAVEPCAGDRTGTTRHSVLGYTSM